MEAIATNERKAGEMFTSSGLKRLTAWRQFGFTTGISLAVMLVGRFIGSKELMIYSGSFGVVFFALWNPWLALLAEDNNRYFIHSVIAYILISTLFFSLIYLWTGLSIVHSMEMRFLLFSTTFYGIVAYATMVSIKVLFLDLSEGGM